MFDERGEPISHPLKTWQEVQRWKPSDARLLTGAVTTTLRRLRNGRRSLVCHDMAGGYLQDKFTQGSADSEAYRFYHWQHVDIFVYFSHYFVTIPPPGWINAAHLHGTAILGTLITEWEDGKKLCEKFLESREVSEKFAETLAQIAQTYGFDGWLINIENIIEKEKVEMLEEFVRLLTQKMHEKKEHSIVLWYDSVINTGELKWQNSLNHLNSKFFDNCDGIFLNYTWKDGHLNYSKEIALRSHRQYDVYVGVDVFGRGCRGGGGYNTREAVQATVEWDLSVAMFAQGWVYETQDKTKFTENEDRFWSLLDDVLPRRETLVYTDAKHLASSFCRGRGTRMFHHSQIVQNTPWSNLSAQSLQPSFMSGQFSDGKEQEMRHHLDDGYHGGGSLRLTGNFTGNSLLYRIFKTDMALSDHFEVHFAHKCQTEGYEVCIRLTFQKHFKKFIDTISYFCGDNDVGEAVFRERPREELSRQFQRTEIKVDNGWKICKSECFLGHGDFRVREVSVEIFRRDKSQAVSCDVLLGFLHIEPKTSVEEVLLVTNVQQTRIPAVTSLTVGGAASDDQEIAEGTTLEATNEKTDDGTEQTEDGATLVVTSQTTDAASAQKHSTLVTWTYPEELGRRLFYVTVERVKDDVRKETLQAALTRNKHFVIAHSVLDAVTSHDDVKVYVSPMTYVGTQQTVSKIIRRSEGDGQ